MLGLDAVRHGVGEWTISVLRLPVCSALMTSAVAGSSASASRLPVSR